MLQSLDRSCGVGWENSGLSSQCQGTTFLRWVPPTELPQASDTKKQKVAYGKGPRMFPEVQDADQFAKQVQAPCNNLDGNALPVSAFVPGGRVPCGTSQYEKRGIAINVPKAGVTGGYRSER